MDRSRQHPPRFFRHTAKRAEILFLSRTYVKLRFTVRFWQVKAGFDRLYPFHALRHTAVTNVYRASRDLFLAQRFARHVSPLTTTIYTHPSDQEMWERIRGLSC